MPPFKPAMTAEQLCKLLDRADITQVELARRILVDKQTVHRWCKGTSKINKRNAVAIRAALKS